MRFLILLFLVCWSAYAWGQGIVRGEYFIDTDPGVGSATPIVFSTPADTVEQAFEYSTQGLAPGPHTLVVRIQDEAGNWSIGKYSRFYVEGEYTLPEPNQLVAAEYFVDTDPGPGNATPVGGISPADSLLTPASSNTTGLTPGLHTLGIRVKDAAGQWSLSKYYRFMIEDYTPETADTSNIVAVEYFLDSEDPGIGNATALPVDTPGQTVTVSDTINMVSDSLALGRHEFLVRVKDSKGRWSLTNIKPFDYCIPEGVTAGFDYSLNGNEITFIDLSSYGVDYRWKMGNGDVLVDSVPIYQYEQGGIYEVCQIVWNRCDIDTFCQTITVPTPRIADSIADFSILEDSPQTIVVEDLNTVFEDLDGDPLTFDVKSDTSLIPATLLDGKAFAIAATDDYVRTIGVNVTATGGGVSVTQRVIVTVLSVNDTPYVAEPIADVVYDEDSGPRVVANNLEDNIVDPDDKRYRRFDRADWRWRRTRLDFTASSDNPGIEPEIVNNDSLVLHLGQDWNGVANVTLTATDDSLVATDHTFQVTVLSLEDDPRLVSPIPDVSFQEDLGTYLVGAVSNFFLEPDGQVLNVQPKTDTSAVQLAVANNAIQITTDDNFHGSAVGIVSANDGFAVVTDTFNITVLPVNDPPVFTGLADVDLCPSGSFGLNLSGKYTDAESSTDALQLGATVVVSSNPAVNKNTLQLQWQGDTTLLLESNATEATTYSLMITASDPQQNVGRDTILVRLLGASIQVKGDTLVANSGGSYQWHINESPIPNATQQTYIGKGAGVYQVAVTVGNCTTLSEGVNVTSLTDTELAENTMLYPNPTEGLLNCRLQTSYGGAIYFRITDLPGKVMWEKRTIKNTPELIVPMDMLPFPHGLYLLEIKTERGQITKRIIKE